MIKRIAINALLSLPAFMLCSLSYILQIEKTHYMFPNPGINSDSVLIITIFCLLSFIYQAGLLFFRHKYKIDFIFPYLVSALSMLRLLKVILIYEQYFQ